MARYSIALYENPIISAARWLDDLTPFLKNSWRHGTREWGGNWQAEGEYKSDSLRDKERFFMANLGRRIIVNDGGVRYWDGQIVRMELEKNGQTFVRSIEDLGNRTKLIFRKVGPQLLANGDVEGGAWGSVGTPSTIETVTSGWFAKGATAMHCVTDAADEGMELEAAVAITASRAYTCSVVVNVVSGTWTLQILQAGTSTVIAQRATSGAGDEWLTCQIPETNDQASVDIHLIADDAARECYADAAILRLTAQRSETKWYEDADSIARYGRIEAIFLEGEMTDDHAAGKAQRELAKLAWPTTTGPDRGGTIQLADDQPSSLIISCLGWVWSLSWRHTLTDGTDQASDHIAALVNEWELASSAIKQIDTNSAEALVSSTNPITIWKAVENVLEAGDGSGGHWNAGVYPSFTFRYGARRQTRTYETRRGELFYFGGGTVHPIAAQPGYIFLSDMPTEPTPAGAAITDDPRWQLATEMWFISDENGERNEWVYGERT